MKILHIITSLGIGGAEKLLLDTAPQQVESGHEVSVIYFKQHDLVADFPKEIRVFQLDINLKTIFSLHKKIKELQPNVVHTHLTHADLFAILLSPLHKRTQFFTTMHNIGFQWNYKDYFYYALYYFLFHIVNRNLKVICISEDVKNFVKSKMYVKEKRLVLLHNSIKQISTSYPKTENAINITVVGRFIKRKSIETVLLAISELSDEYKKKIKVNIVGYGEEKNALHTLRNDLKLNNIVQFLGKQKDTEKYYSQAHIFILSSLYEGFGIVILEAFRAKCAVISSDIPGPNAIVKHQENGLLFQPKHYEELAEKITLLIDNPQETERLAKNGYDDFLAHYEITQYVKKLEAVYLA